MIAPSGRNGVAAIDLFVDRLLGQWLMEAESDPPVFSPCYDRLNVDRSTPERDRSAGPKSQTRFDHRAARGNIVNECACLTAGSVHTRRQGDWESRMPALLNQSRANREIGNAVQSLTPFERHKQGVRQAAELSSQKIGSVDLFTITCLLFEADSRAAIEAQLRQCPLWVESGHSLRYS